MLKQPSGILISLNTILLVLIAGCTVATLMETRALAGSVKNYEAYSDLGEPVRSSSSISTGATVDPSGGLTAAEVRLIVRGELAAAVEVLTKAQGVVESRPATEIAQTMPERGESEVSRDVVDVENTLSSFMYRGQADSAEMAQLQAMIARLPPPERERAMRQLNRAINSGALEAPM